MKIDATLGLVFTTAMALQVFGNTLKEGVFLACIPFIFYFIYLQFKGR